MATRQRSGQRTVSHTKTVPISDPTIQARLHAVLVSPINRRIWLHRSSVGARKRNELTLHIDKRGRRPGEFYVQVSHLKRYLKEVEVFTCPSGSLFYFVLEPRKESWRDRVLYQLPPRNSE